MERTAVLHKAALGLVVGCWCLLIVAYVAGLGFAAWIAVALSPVGIVMGILSWGRPQGKMAAILGLLMMVVFLLLETAIPGESSRDPGVRETPQEETK